MQRTTPSTTPTFAATSVFAPSSSLRPSRPATREGIDPLQQPPQSPPPPVPGSPSASSSSAAAAALAASRDRKTSFSRKASLSLSSSRRRGTGNSTGGSVSSASGGPSSSHGGVVTDAAAPPALPDYALGAAAKIVSRDKRDGDGVWSPVSPPDAAFGFSSAPGAGLPRSTTSTTATSFMPPPTPSGGANGGGNWYQSEAAMIHQQISDVANKRISTLDYLRKAHEARVYWFNTYLFDRSDLSRMPLFDPRKLARKATNHLLLGLSIPTINDLYSSTPLEFLRCLNSLLSEFDSFQQIHGDSSASLSRARLPNMFRRPGGKSRRSTSTNDMSADDPQALSAGGGASNAPSVMNFAASESDLLPGEEYTYLLTPSLPFDPDFFETFATLCDVLIDCYTRFLALVPTPRECSAPVAELFTKADSKVRKIIVQGVVKEFDDHSRTHVKTEVANIGKVVLGGLM